MMKMSSFCEYSMSSCSCVEKLVRSCWCWLTQLKAYWKQTAHNLRPLCCNSDWGSAVASSPSHRVSTSQHSFSSMVTAPQHWLCICIYCIRIVNDHRHRRRDKTREQLFPLWQLADARHCVLGWGCSDLSDQSISDRGQRLEIIIILLTGEVSGKLNS